MAWFDSYEDSDRAAIVAKGWDKLEGEAASRAIYQSYRQLEKMPRPEAAPKSADEYRFEGVVLRDGKAPDVEFLGFARSLALDLGLPASKAPILADKLLRYGDAADDASTSALQARIEAGTTALKSGWGSDYDKNVDVAGRAFEAMNMPKEHVDALVEAMGVDKVMTWGHGLATKMGEATFLKGDHLGAKQATMTREEALIERNKMVSDTTFGAKLLSGDADAVKRLEDVSKSILGTPDNFTPAPTNFGRVPGPNNSEDFNPNAR